eukprot:6657967-Prymnesium_polylepis.1
MATVQKSDVQPDTLTPSWAGEFCVSLTPRADPRVCFDIRDDFDPALPADDPPLLHFICAALEPSWGGSQSLELSDGAILTFRLYANMPAPPPAPPQLPHPPLSPPRTPPPPQPPGGAVLRAINQRFKRATKFSDN